MFENLCTLPLTSDLFAQALHPTEPILAVGLSSGHVQSFRLPPVPGDNSSSDDGNTSVISTGTSTIDTEWRTRRHKGSCRTLAYSYDGEVLYSAGTDSLLKAASTTTGQVLSKILLPPLPFPMNNTTDDPPTLLHPLTPQTLLLATDSARLHLFDLRLPSHLSSKPAQTHRPHDDYISSLTPLPPSNTSTSGLSKQWVTTGGTTLAVTDLRRGVLVKSEDQEEELLSSVYVSGLRARPGGSRGEKVVVGGAGGVITLWEKGVWDDQDERIIVDGSGGKDGGESLDVMVLMPEGVGSGGGRDVVVGVGDGTVRVVRLGVNKVVEVLRHDEVEGVVGAGFDVGGRLISGGGSLVKVWGEKMSLDEEEEDGEEDSDSDVDSDAGEGGEDEEPEVSTATTKKRELEVEPGAEAKDNSDAESSEEEESNKRRKKRRKSKKSKTDIGNGILKFKGM